MAQPIPIGIVRDVMIYAASVVFAYLGGVAFVYLFVAEPQLVDIVSACKIVSLLILIYANREIPEMIELDRHADISIANFGVIIISGLILVLMVVKTVVDGQATATFPPAGQTVIGFFSRNAYWISVIPVFCYVALDLFIAFVRRGAKQDRHNAMEFVVFRDLVCAGPLALVLLLAEVYGQTAANEPAARATAEVFFSGALAVILLSSAIATKALNRLQHERRPPLRQVARGAPPTHETPELTPHGDPGSVVARIAGGSKR
jgi:hypothetical protein